ncbi:MAG: hypothetical protein IJ544_04130 [Prevotella sp.]|nr:hypothetical protein [Prevotella sp.]
MSKKILTALVFLLATVLTGCKEDSADISVTSMTADILYPVVNQKTEVTFNVSSDWKATCNASWLNISPTEGKAGKNTITVTTTQTNRTKSQRSAVVTISAGSSQKSVTIRQSGEYALFDQKEYNMGAEGGSLNLTFATNVDIENLTIAYNASLDWIDWAAESRATDEWTGQTHALVVEPNTGKDPRTAIYVLAMMTDGDDWVGLDTCYVQQAGLSTGYESTDYSQDGKITVLQQASQGKGIPVVLMGDGFADRDIADGTYQTAMEKAVENLFSEEPVKSLRDYFTVYCVTAVSKHDNVGEDYSTVFSCVPDPQSSNIEADADMVMNYVRKVENIDSLNTLAVVILNTNIHKGVTYLYSNPKANKPIQYAVAFCPVIESLESEMFRTVLVHEAIGHGLGKLADEYGYKENGSPTPDEVNELKNYHTYNWLKNVDATSDETKVDWHAFIGDRHFSNEEIGVYEGGYTYMLGIYRPTTESMMNSNSSPFNAPSRKAIYDRVKQLGEDKAASTFDEFAAFDEQHKPEQWSYTLSRGFRTLPAPHFAQPVMKHRNW